MSNPPNAKVWPRQIDPKDIELFQIHVSQGAGDTDTLSPTENVASYQLALTAEAIAAGLQIVATGLYAPSIAANFVTLYLTVDSAHQADAAFSGTGLMLGVELTVVTDATPPRTKQKTQVVQVAQQ